MPSLWFVVGILGVGFILALVVALLLPWSDDNKDDE